MTERADQPPENEPRDSGPLFYADLSSIGQPILEELRMSLASSIIASAEGVSAFGGFRDPHVRARLHQSLNDLGDQSFELDTDTSQSTE